MSAWPPHGIFGNGTAMNLKLRDRRDEWMDEPDLDADLHAEALRGLSRVNRFSGSVGSIWHPIAELSRRDPGEMIRVLDVACGGGDVAIGLKQTADRKGIAMEVVGCDISPTAIAFARDTAKRRKVDVSFVTQDVLGEPFPGGFDVVCSSLFLHHLDEDDIVRLLKAMRLAARQRVVISDLLRSRFGFVLAKWGIRVLTSSEVCHVDGPLSVRAALTIPEIKALAERADMKSARIARLWPERFLMVCDGAALE